MGVAVAPLPPGLAALCLFYRHKYAVIRQPWVLHLKGFDLGRQGIVYAQKSLLQQRQSAFTGKGKVRRVRRAVVAIGCYFFRRRQAHILQSLRVDKQVVAGKSGGGAIGTSGSVNRIKGQHLPVGKAHVRNTVDKVSGVPVKHADPIRGGQGADVHKHTGAALVQHKITSSNCFFPCRSTARKYGFYHFLPSKAMAGCKVNKNSLIFNKYYILYILNRGTEFVIML